jgi:hypothetical protein
VGSNGALAAKDPSATERALISLMTFFPFLCLLHKNQFGDPGSRNQGARE